MATSSVPPGRSAGQPPSITEIAPDVVTTGPDYTTGGVAFELFDATANVGFRTIFDVGDALDAVMRMVAASARLRRLIAP